MKRLFAWALLTSLASAGQGCLVRSLAPVYTAESIVKNDAILGEWVPAERELGDLVLIFEEGGQSDYLLRLRPEKPPPAQDPAGSKELRAAATIAQVAEHQLLDLSLAPGSERDLGEHAWLVLPTHYFFRVETKGTSLRLASLDPRWLKRWIDKHPGKLAHAVLGGNEPANRPGDAAGLALRDRMFAEIILTGTPAEMQQFIRDHAADTGAWSWAEFRRRGGADPADSTPSEHDRNRERRAEPVRPALAPG